MVENRKPKSTIRADSEGLDVARRVAERIGSSFDEQLTRETADRLHRTYFEEIRKVLGPICSRKQLTTANTSGPPISVSVPKWEFQS